MTRLHPHSSLADSGLSEPALAGARAPAIPLEGVIRGPVRIHPPEAFAFMRAAGRLAAQCLDMLAGEVREGVTTARLDELAREFALDHKAIPACINYRGYRHTICTSLNHVVCHGIPGDRELKPGDIVNIDVTLIVDGWHGDTSRMYAVPPVKKAAARLMEVTFEAMMRGIAVVRPGMRLGDVGHAIQSFAESRRFSVVRDFCGHGIGRVFHDSPNVLHYGRPGEGIELEPGMFFTVEPMINLGKPGVLVLPDGWTAITRDRTLSAQFEHTIGVTEDGAEIFTGAAAGLEQPFRAALDD